ncbi:hypothetical protein SDC9_160928 [bioreactor metagenome]|uniref:Uncharacterized protein n=1 Tax=bioreactor metagenome TaxID=1076179 RepID=A0A645FIZ0_9ZZZZ
MFGFKYLHECFTLGERQVGFVPDKLPPVFRHNTKILLAKFHPVGELDGPAHVVVGWTDTVLCQHYTGFLPGLAGGNEELWRWRNVQFRTVSAVVKFPFAVVVGLCYQGSPVLSAVGSEHCRNAEHVASCTDSCCLLGVSTPCKSYCTDTVDCVVSNLGKVT